MEQKAALGPKVTNVGGYRMILAEKGQTGIRYLDMNNLRLVLIPELADRQDVQSMGFSPEQLLAAVLASGGRLEPQAGEEGTPVAESEGHARSGKCGPGDFIEDRINRAISFMRDNYKEDIDLPRIAMTACLSQSYFCRLFKVHTGTTYIKFLAGMRVREAIKLLEETDLRITDICFETGFNDLTHFERVFKGIVGVTPSLYRNGTVKKGGNRRINYISHRGEERANRIVS
jgi:AraC-like DNA-binding protein